MGGSHARKEEGTMKTFISEVNNIEVTRHLNIVTPQLLTAVLEEEQLRHTWTRLGPWDADGNGNSCHGDRKDRPTKGITNMHESVPAWHWKMNGNAAKSLHHLSTHGSVRFAEAGGSPLCDTSVPKEKKIKRSMNGSPCLCWCYSLAYSSLQVTENNHSTREGERKNQ